MKQTWKESLLAALAAAGRQSSLCSCRVSSNIEDEVRRREEAQRQRQQPSPPASAPEK